MSSTAETLTPTELARITGKRRAPQQAAVLARLGVPFTFRVTSVEVDRMIAKAFALLPDAGRGVDLSKVR